ncbi:plasmid mobilization protein [Faecalibacillus intestinalis]
MSAKNVDNKNRWRNKTVAFRVSPEEWEQLEKVVKLTGLTKQDYITRKLLNQEVIVQGNTRVFKALRNELTNVLIELRRIESGSAIDDELLNLIEIITIIMGGLKGDDDDGN